MRLVLAVIACVVAFVAVVILISYPIDALSCKREWEDSGMHSRYSFLADCQVEVAPGHWIPAKSYSYRKGQP